MKRNPSTRAKVLVVSRFVRVLESTPTTHIVNKNCPKLCVTANNVFQQCAEALATFNDYAAPTGVFVCLYDIEAVILGVLLNSDSLIGNRILFILSGNSQVFEQRESEVSLTCDAKPPS